MDIGIQEIFLISVLALFVLGPERLPSAVRSIAIWIGRIKRSFNDIKADIEREINADEIRQQIHNENVLHQIDKAANELSQAASSVEKEFQGLTTSFDRAEAGELDGQDYDTIERKNAEHGKAEHNEILPVDTQLAPTAEDEQASQQTAVQRQRQKISEQDTSRRS